MSSSSATHTHTIYIYIYVYIWDLSLIITASADVLAPKYARPSAGTMLTLGVFLKTFFDRQQLYKWCFSFVNQIEISREYFAHGLSQWETTLGHLAVVKPILKIITGFREFMWHLCGTQYIPNLHPLTHWGRDKMADIFQRTFSNAFSWMNMYELRFRFLWSLFPRVQLTISKHWFRWWLDADQATSHYLNQSWLFYWRIYASLGLNELTLVCVSWHQTHLMQSRINV